MCAISVAVTAISTVVGMVGQYMQYKNESKAQQAQADYNAQIAANDAATKQQLAQNEIAKGSAERDRLLRDGARHQGKMRSQLAAGGFEMDSGSSLSLLGESATEIQHDAEIMSHNAAMAAWGHQVGVTQAQNDQAWSKYQGQQAKSGKGAMMIGMGGSLLGGIGKGLNQWNELK